MTAKEKLKAMSVSDREALLKNIDDLVEAVEKKVILLGQLKEAVLHAWTEGMPAFDTAAAKDVAIAANELTEKHRPMERDFVATLVAYYSAVENDRTDMVVPHMGVVPLSYVRQALDYARERFMKQVDHPLLLRSKLSGLARQHNRRMEEK